MKVSLIAAMGKNRCIGKDGKLPWHLPEDLQYFRKTTAGHPVVMGRKTFESIGKPLPGRENIVLSKKGLSRPGVRVFSDLKVALEALNKSQTNREVFIVGGAQIYAQALPLADRIYLTVIEQNFDGDSFFPSFDESKFKISSKRDSKQGDLDYSFIVYDRI